MVLHVEGDRGADRRGRLHHRPHELEGEVVPAGQRLAERRQLHRHLGGPAQAERLEAGEQREVGVPGVLGLRPRGDVLAQVVERHLDAVGGQRADDAERVGQGLPRDEPVDHPPGGRVARDETAQPRSAGGGQQGLLGEHGTSDGTERGHPTLGTGRGPGPATSVRRHPLCFHTPVQGGVRAGRPAGTGGPGVPAARGSGDARGRRIHAARLLRALGRPRGRTGRRHGRGPHPVDPDPGLAPGHASLVRGVRHRRGGGPAADARRSRRRASSPGW